MSNKKSRNKKNNQEGKLGGHSPSGGVSPYLTGVSSSPKLSQAEVWFSALVFIAVGILIFYPPYFRGLFFNEDMFVYHIITGLVFILVWIEKISRKEFSFMETPLDWAILAYAGAYLLSLTGAVHIGEAICGFLKTFNYFMVYFMVTQVVRDYRRYEYMLKIILASGVGVATIGILAAVGLSQYPSAFESNTLRILSTLQYPNTTAAYLAVISLIGVTLWIRERKPLMKIIYGTAIYLLMLVVLAAFSKGAWIIFILGAILLLVGMPGVYRIKSTYILGLAATAALITYNKFIPAVPAMTKKEPIVALKMLLIGFFIVLGGQVLWEIGIILQRRKGNRTIAFSVTGMLLIVLLVFFYLPETSELAKQILPDNLRNQISGVKDIKTTSYSSRLDFARWGMAIVKDHPVVGTGAGGWNALYHQYQDYLTWTTETHNHFVQVWVESGTIGIIAFITIWICLFLALFRIYQMLFKSSEGAKTVDSIDHWVLIWGTTTTVLAFGVHAAMDFDLSLGAMTILLWTLFALLNAAYRISVPNVMKQSSKPAINISLAVIASLIMLFCGSNLSLASNCALKGDVLLLEASKPEQTPDRQGKLTTATDLFTKATMADSYNANYHGSLAQAYALLFSQAAKSQSPLAQEYYDKTKQEIKKAGELSPYNIKLRNTMANLCLGLNDIEGAVEQARWAIRSNPNDINAYEGFMHLSLRVTELYLNQNNPSQASYYAQEIVNQPKEIKVQSDRINPERAWNGRKLSLNSAALLTLGKAQFLLGQYQEALISLESLFPLIQKGEFKAPETMAWYLACLDKTGNSAKAKGLRLAMEKEGNQSVQLYQHLTGLKPLPLSNQEGS